MKSHSIPRSLQAAVVTALMVLLAACSAAPLATPDAGLATEPATATAISNLPAANTAMPTPDATPVPTCAQTQGTIVNVSLPAPMLKYPLAVKVYLPPCYSRGKTEEYPVLYMLHGMTDTNQQWVDLGLTDTADRLISAGRIQPMIIVMPYEVNWQLSPEESGYEKAIVDLLIPWVDENYNTCTARDCRAIGGLSRGGNWAVTIGFDHWQLFTAIGAHSTPLFIGGIQALTSDVRKLPSVSDAPAVYVDAGDKDENLSAVKDFEKTLTTLHVPHEYHLNTGAHDAAYWSAHVEDYLLWYASELRK